ncbi:sn-glycerol-3-phosphate ABC transporter ATP-binding protein UgpC [Orrella daihaiensis]|uniref:Sn-glycerol-3-phosphate ABC transporter ATP-binding protein UgpC n=1 Tax=Orrella daihaiensis TaxID=2782176 RepID=A0ABY4AIT0_9BURK|nr:sn-glycerol-3-phosphate ABC transporter ATP-binding protein UgpC [Orrella daihaiensis]UOD49848.1 sn-glycerol-3-phosphate ABC transporter ATP-binding protein UgpC [Orrella daihaiensis]
MADIILDNLRKSYGNTDVIHGINGQINDSEFVVVVGASGCGKSTLLRMLAGLETVTSGDIRIDGVRVNDLEPSQRDIAMVFQNYALYPHMTVFENMAYSLKIQGKSKAQIKDAVQRAADILEITAYLDRKPRQLSGGQRQRVAMGRAIVREPKVFLFDEPLSNLDAKLRVQMRVEIKQLQKRLGTTSVYVTHDQVEAMTLGDRLMVLNAGKVEQFGAPIDLYEQPQTQFVAGFIGSPAMNFFAARITDSGAKVLVGSQIELQLAKPFTTNEPEVTVGIRPEHMFLNSDGPFEIELQLQEHLGAETLLHAKLTDSGQSVTVLVPGYQQFDQNSRLKVGYQPDKVHVFGRDGGRLN